jgi:DNA-directed RNA polymerase subunit RPC12/RpoP
VIDDLLHWLPDILQFAGWFLQSPPAALGAVALAAAAVAAAGAWRRRPVDCPLCRGRRASRLLSRTENPGLPGDKQSAQVRRIYRCGSCGHHFERNAQEES